MKKEITFEEFNEILKECEPDNTYSEILERLMIHYNQKSNSYQNCDEELANFFAEKRNIIYNFLIEHQIF